MRLAVDFLFIVCYSFCVFLLFVFKICLLMVKNKKYKVAKIKWKKPNIFLYPEFNRKRCHDGFLMFQIDQYG